MKYKLALCVNVMNLLKLIMDKIFFLYPAVQAADADPFRYNSTNRQSPPIQQKCFTFEPVMQFGCPSG